MTIFRRTALRKYQDPDYAGLSNVVFHSRAEGLVSNTTNSYGVVNASDHVTKWISVLTTTHEFDTNGTAANITLSGSGVEKVINFAGSARLRHNGLNSVWNNFQHRAVQADIKACIHMVVKIGTIANPNAIYGLFGNYAGASTNRGIGCHFDDRSSLSLNNQFNLSITRGTSNSFVLQATNGNILPTNQWLDIWIQYDIGQADEADRGKIFINGKRYTISIRIDAGSATTPSFAMEIGDIGNATAPGIISLKEITFQDGVETEAFIRKFTRARMTKYRITPIAYSIDSIIQRTKIKPQNVLTESRYYLSCFWLQNPTNTNTLVNVFSDGLGHTDFTTRKISRRVSTDMGHTVSSKIDAYNPGGTSRPIDPGVGYGNDGRLHMIVDMQDGEGDGAGHALHYLYSDNDGATWSSPADITSVLPADGLLTWRVYCHIIENAGRLMLVMYKVAEDTIWTSSARYLIYSDNNGSTWNAILIQSSVTLATFRNESAIIALSSTVLLVVTRDENTLEWYQSMSTDNGATWSNQGALTFSESLGRAAPVRLVKFQISGTTVVACYYPDRDRDQLKVVYALPANLISSGLTGWNIPSKHVVYQGSGGLHLHYGQPCHYNNDFHANAMYPKDEFPGSGTGTVNTLNQYELETIHYSDVKTLLGL